MRDDIKAVLLIGGQGTRLGALTEKLAKSLWYVCDREIVDYQISQLARAGISEIIFAAGHQVEQLIAFKKHYSGITLRVSTETQPLGTAGALRNAARLLNDKPTVVMNADILSDIDISLLLDTHNLGNKPITMTGVVVPDPGRYGVLSIEDQPAAVPLSNERHPDPALVSSSIVANFVEKPQPPFPAKTFINAGAYVINRSVIDAIPEGRFASLEKDVFPAEIQRCGGFSHLPHEGLWMDAGTFQGYFDANFRLLERRFVVGEDSLWGRRDRNYSIKEPLIYKHAKAFKAESANLQRKVILMDGAWIEEGCQLADTIVLPEAWISRDTQLERCIVGPGCTVPPGTAATDKLFMHNSPVLDINW